jgi:hypothetical protein
VSRGRRTRRAGDRLARTYQAPNDTSYLRVVEDATTPKAFMRTAHGLIGGRLRSRTLTKKRRHEIATQAAQTRWSKHPSKETKEPHVVTCDDCGLSWIMGETPVCARLAHFPMLPPVQQLEERARDICFRLLHNGSRRDFDDYLEKRPDWRAHVEYIVLQLMETCSH